MSSDASDVDDLAAQRIETPSALETSTNTADLARLHERTSTKWRQYAADVLPLFIAEMDYPLAPPIAAALHAAIDRSDTGYAWPNDLREVFARYARAAFDWPVEFERVVITGDVMGGIAEALRTLTEPDDGVAIMPPVYPPFFAVVASARRRVVEVPLRLDPSGYAIDWDALEIAFAQGVKTLLLCHPHNPTGQVLSRAALERLAQLAQQYAVLVISDEIHAPLTFAGVAHVPFATVAEPLGVDSVTLMSASKAWNIPGLKCAQMIAGSERVQTAFKRLPHDVTYRIGHLGIIATIAAYEHGGPWLDETLARLDKNRTVLASALRRQLPHIRYRIPDATYLAWLDCRDLPLGDDPAAAFTEHARVALAHGPAFGAAGRGFARFNFATTPGIITEAIDRIARCVAKAQV